MNKMHTPRYKDTIYESITADEKHDRVNVLGFYDVICGRHKAAFDNIGNRRFRVLVALAHEKYANASSRAHKSIVIKDIVDSVHNGGGRFLQRLGCNWVELDDKQTHDKVGHALRDMAVASKAKTSNQKLRKNSIDYSDQSNTSKSNSRASTTPKSNMVQQARHEDCRSVVNGYIVSFPKGLYPDKSDILALKEDPNDFLLDEFDDSLEPIAWPSPSQSHRRSHPVDEYIVSKVFTIDDIPRSTIYNV
jgi:hypothetical protein